MKTLHVLGSTQAEDDSPMLERAFLETADYRALRDTQDFNVVIGRRGTGKSALYHKLRQEFSFENEIVTISEEPQDFEMLEYQKMISSLAKDYRVLRTITRLLWSVHTITSTATKLSRHHRFSHSGQSWIIRKYLIDHADILNLSGVALCITLLRKLVKRSVLPEELAPQIVQEYQLGETIEAMRAVLMDMKVTAVVLYDRLDEAWVPEVSSVAILGGLVRCASEYRERKIGIYPILFVRDNMFRALSQMDDDFTRHIEGPSLRLQWDEDALFHLVNARLRISLELENVEAEEKVWNKFVSEDLQGRKGFIRCLRYTLYRPRDIITLLNEAYLYARRSNRDVITPDDIERSSINISKHRLDDLCKEYDTVLPGLKLFVTAFSGQPAIRQLNDVVSSLEEIAETSDYSEQASRDLVLFSGGGEMFSALYSVGFVGLRDIATGNFVFCHDGAESALVSIDAKRETLVHPCYWKALDVAVAEEASNSAIQLNDEYVAPKQDQTLALRLKRLGRVPEELNDIPLGHAGSKLFEEWVLRSVRLLFSGPLTNSALHPNPKNALNQRDVIATNAETTSFWRRIYEDYQSRQIIFECKNYEEVSADDFRQVLDYLSGEYGGFGIIVRRGTKVALTEKEKDRIRSMYHEHNKLVMVMPSSMLALSIRKLRPHKKYDYAEFTIGSHMDMIVRSILSLSQTRKYKQKRK